MRRTTSGGIYATWLALAALTSQAAEPITTESLLNELMDLQAVSRYPDPFFTTGQTSSYDRASKTPDDPDTWFANHDRGHYLRTEEIDGRTEYVMLDVEGPGAIVRIWSANPAGTLRLYLDGSEVPALAAPMEGVLGGKFPTLPPPLAGVRAAGHVLYFPFPYAKRAKLTSDAGGFYYTVDYRTYAPGTEVETYETGDLTALQPQIKQIAAAMQDPYESYVKLPELRTISATLPLKEQGTEHYVGMDGHRAVVEMSFRVKAEDPNRALSEVLLRVVCDGRETVVAPLGAFFGTAPGFNRYESLPMGVIEGHALWSHWLMPFQRDFKVYLKNYGKQPVDVEYVIVTAPYDYDERNLYFFAKFRSERGIDTRPFQDWNFGTITGRGALVGAALYIGNPVRQWWGEGDEKIYVDDDEFPTWFGTGSEDYFGYAWCSPELFTHVFHNQTRCDGPANYGNTAVNRWQIIDRIPFKKRLQFDMELWHWAETQVDLSAMLYWYAPLDSRDNFPALTEDDLVYRPVPQYVAPRVAGAIEGEEMRIVKETGVLTSQEVRQTSNDHHLWWHGETKPGDRVVLAFDAKEAGPQRVFARFVKSGDYGTVRAIVNDGEPSEPIDLYSEHVVITDEIDLGVHEIRAGENRLTLEITGANEKAVEGKYFAGLDYVRLTSPVEPPGGEEEAADNEADDREE